jgi:predicted transcriptional regulator
MPQLSDSEVEVLKYISTQPQFSSVKEIALNLDRDYDEVLGIVKKLMEIGFVEPISNLH